MRDRRDFLRAVVNAAAATFIASHWRIATATQNPPSRRREVSLGNRRIKIIDIHGHFIAPEELDLIKDTDLARNIAGQPGSLILDAARVRTLDERGIDVQVLTHQGAWWYKTDRDLAQRLIKVQNE